MQVSSGTFHPLTSGYGHLLPEQGLVGIELLQKPYSLEQLVQTLLRHLPPTSKQVN